MTAGSNNSNAKNSDAKQNTPPQKKRSLRRYLLYGGGGLVLLLILAYFIGTSSWFIRSYVLPLASKSAGVNITASDVSLSPFSSIELKGLEVKTFDNKPIARIGTAKVSYSLSQILKGNYKVSEIIIQDPVVEVVFNADGTSNLDPFLKKPSAPSPQTAGKPSNPLLFDIAGITINNGTISYTRRQKDGSFSANLRNLNFKIEGVKNSGSPSVNLATAIELLMSAGTNKNALAGNISAQGNINLNSELTPENAKASVDLAIQTASGDFADTAGLNSSLQLDASLNQIKSFVLKFAKNNRQLGVVDIAGTFNIDKKEAKLRLNLSNVTGESLSLIGAKFGLGINTAGLNTTINLQSSNGGKLIETSGSILLDKLSLLKGGIQTPPLDLKSQFDIKIDLSASNAIVRALGIEAHQEGKRIVSSSLSSDLVVNWAGASESIGDSTFKLVVTDFDFSKWWSIIGTNINSGTINSTLSATVKKAGAQIAFNLSTELDKLNAVFGTNRLTSANISLKSQGELVSFADLSISSFDFEFKEKGEQALMLSGAGRVNITNLNADFTLAGELNLPVIAKSFIGSPDISISYGLFRYSGKVSQQLLPHQTGSTNALYTRKITGQAALSDLTGVILTNRFNRYSIASDLDVAVTGDDVLISKLTGSLNSDGRPAGEFTLSGKYNLAKSAGEFAIKLASLNQDALQPFIPKSKDTPELNSITISSDLTASYNPTADSTLRGNIQLAKLQITDPIKKTSQILPDANLNIDATLTTKGLVDIKKLNLLLFEANKQLGSTDLIVQYDLTNNACKFKLVSYFAGEFNIENASTKSTSTVRKMSSRNVSINLPDGGKLKTVALNAALEGNYDPKSASSVKGTVVLTNLVILNSNNVPRGEPLSVALNLVANTAPKGVFELQRFSATTLAGNTPAGKFDITATYNTNDNSAAFTVKVDNLNQNLIKPFIDDAQSEKKLQSISINADLAGAYNPKTDSSLKGDIKVANLIVQDKDGKLGKLPLDFGFSVDASLSTNIARIRKCLLTLTPTQRAVNQLNLNGNVDLTKSNAIAGNIKISADSLDVTPYYDIFGGDQKKEPAKQPPQSQPETEPPAVTLPLSNFVANISIGRFYLRELEITNLNTAAKIDGGSLNIDPVQLVLNGADLNGYAKLVLNVPGYKYDLALKANGIPVEPLADSFSPEMKNKASGKIFGDIVVKGSGVTGKNLRENLNGKVTLSLTNAHIQFVSPMLKFLLTPVAIALGIPDILQSPIDYIGANIQLGSGDINIQNFTLRSPVFIAESYGIIPISDVLTNSPLDLPIEISLKREYTKNFILQNLSQSGDYVKLPKFVQVKGTIGSPDVKVDKTTIIGLTAIGIGGAAGTKAGNIIRGVGNIITGQPLINTNQLQQPSTNAPPKTPVAPINDLLNIFRKPRN